jgi:hypothetical protein
MEIIWYVETENGMKNSWKRFDTEYAARNYIELVMYRAVEPSNAENIIKNISALYLRTYDGFSYSLIEIFNIKP